MRADDLPEPERRLWMAFPYGMHIDLRTEDPEENDPAAAQSWDLERIVRAEVIRDLLVGRRPVDEQQEREQGPGRSPSVFLSGARITGRLDLSGIDLQPTLLLQQCALDEPLVITDSMSRSIRLYGCHLPGVEGAWLTCAGDLHLRGCKVNGAVDLSGAHVGGQLVLSGSTLSNPGKVAVCADGLVVAGDVLCRDQALAEGEFSLVAARVGGELRFTGSRLHNPGKVALRADRITVEKDMYCREGSSVKGETRFTVEGEVRLPGGQVKGQLDFNHATLNNPGGVALRADHLVVGSHLYCQDHFTADGEVNLVAARVGGEVRFSASALSNPGGVALRADRLYVTDDMYCRQGLEIDGEVSLRGAHIKGQLNFNHATLRNSGGVALRADQLVVGSHLYCQDHFTADGEINLMAARVGGEVRFSTSTLSNPDGIALCAERLTVAGDMYCREKLTVSGEIDLRAAQIGGQLNFNRSELRNEGKIALQADHLVLGGHLHCHDGFDVKGGISLVAARVGGEVRFSASTLSNPKGVALRADRLFVAADMYCREKLEIEGIVSLRGAHIAGQLNFNDAKLHKADQPVADADQPVFDADQLVVGSHFYCQAGFKIEGGISLVAARVGGEVRFSASTLSNPGGVALCADRFVVEKDMYCREGLEIDGEVRLHGAHVKGDLIFSTAAVRNPGRTAICADQLTVGNDLCCDEGFTADGMIDLSDVHINGELSLSRARLHNPDRVALLAPRLIVDKDMFCRDGFIAEGTVCLIGAHIGGKLSFTRAHLTGAKLTEKQLLNAGIKQMLTSGVQPTGSRQSSTPPTEERQVGQWRALIHSVWRWDTEPESAQLQTSKEVATEIVSGASGLALVADGLRVEIDMTCDAGFTACGEIRLKAARIRQNLDFSDAAVENKAGVALNAEDVQAERMLMPARCEAGRISLRYGKMVELDDKRGVEPDQIDITGLSYETLIPPLDPETRLKWLAENEYEPQPYDQLARSYRQLGYDESARKVQLAQERRRRESLLSPVRKIWGYLQDATIGYGYRPYRAAALFVLVFLAGVIGFWNLPQLPIEGGHTPQFNPVFYTLDVLVPFADFGQRYLWQSTVGYEVFKVILALLGWTLAVTAITGITRALTRS